MPFWLRIKNLVKSTATESNKNYKYLERSNSIIYIIYHVYKCKIVHNWDGLYCEVNLWAKTLEATTIILKER